MRDYCIQSGFAIVVRKANNKIYTVLCSDWRCPWRLHGSMLDDGLSWAIKSKTGDRTCLRLQTRNAMVSTKWAQRVLLEDIRAHNHILGKALNKLLFERYGVILPKSTIHRMKGDALVEIHGGYDVSYSYLPRYCEVMRQTDPTSSAQYIWNSTRHPERPLGFSSIFISFRACLDGLFASGRGLIRVDGTFFKGIYEGVLLSAVALDGNNEMFPVSWAIVSTEDDECSRCFPWPNDVETLLVGSKCNIRFHLWKSNEANRKVKAGARVWLSYLGEQSRWRKRQFNPAFKCDFNNTNFVESFNATLGTDRVRPVMTLVEGIRRRVKSFTKNQDCAWHTNQVLLTVVHCKHGKRAILDANLDPHRFVHEWHSVARYKMAYQHGIKAILDMEQWPKTQAPEIGPLTFRRGVGRPTRKGKRSKSIKCGICGKFGHNKLTCQRGPTRKQKKGKEKKAEVAATTGKKGKEKT
ncbi:Glutamyl-tRNA reductase [Bienertia sinuspersici]